MKKLISIILALIMCIGLVSCQTPKTEEPTVTPEEIEYNIYVKDASSLGGQYPDLGIDLSIYEKVENKLIFNYDYEEYIIDDSAPKTKTFSFLGVDYEGTYEKTLFGSSSINPEYKLYSDSYIALKDGKTYTFSVNRISGKVTSWQNTEAAFVEGDLTLDEAIVKAEEIIKSQNGENALDGYELGVDTQYVSNLKCYYISFVRMLSEHPTDDYIVLRINLKGELYTYQSAEYGSLSKVENDITLERYDAAVEAFKKSIPSDLYIIPGTIFYEKVEEKCYISINVKESKDSEYSKFFYINMW